ncbi:MAG: VWA domain-containing protein [Thermodesulfobacteriota bacterium]
MAETDLADRTVCKDALRSVLVKRGRDIPLFDALFDLHFTAGPRPEPPARDSEPGRDDRLTGLLAELLSVYQPEVSLTTELIMTGRFGELTRLMLGRGQSLGLERMESPLQSGFFTRRLRQEMNLDRVKAEAEAFLRNRLEAGLSKETARAMSDLVERNLRRLEGDLKGLIQKELAGNRFLFVRRLEEEDLAGRSLARLTEDDFLAMRPAVERLARRLKERLSQRLRRAEKGRFDLKKTLRQNIGQGGPLPYLSFRDKRPARPQVAALCDVSNSVRNFSRFMLLFLYTLKEVVPRVRSFIFVGDLTEVTELFRRHELNEAVALAAAGRGLEYVFRTDYGGSLAQFGVEYLNSINPKTTVFILGDARNNYYHPRAEALAAISGRARRLIWLNPEPRLNWRLGDSAMSVYQPYCTLVAECGNLKQLSLLIEENLIP